MSKIDALNFKKKIELIDFLSDPIIVINRESFCIEYINNEAEFLLHSSKVSSIGKKISLFFNETTTIYDYITNSNKRYGTFIYNELKLSNLDFFFNLEIINPEEIKSMILVFKSDKLLNKTNEELNIFYLIIDEIIAKIFEKIKNPITSIRGSTQIIKKNFKDKDQDFFQIILSECKKVIEFIQLFELDYSNISSYKKNENIHEIIRISMKNLKFYSNKNIEIIEEFDPSLPEIKIKKKSIVTVINNILKNSIDSIGNKNGYIRIKTNYILGPIRKLPNIKKSEPKNHICIIVEDNGSGIDKKNFNSIFMPFFSTKSENQGVGLYLSRKIVNEHNGSIEFHSEESKTKFIVNLPI